MSEPATSRDRAIVRALARWFGAHARELPWRDAPAGARDPYRTLVSEVMLQQTQISRVLVRYPDFMRRFPTVAHLARAQAQDVAAAWAGMGYYRRAAMLHAAARAVLDEHGGVFPRTSAELRALPGVGRYTAGAVASLTAGERTPAVDGNVQRVLQRLEARPGAHADAAVLRWAQQRALELVQLAASPGAHNEAIMELGATVCTPRGPRCGECPVRRQCHAHAHGVTDQIPAPKKAAPRSVLWLSPVVVVDGKGNVLVNRRGSRGLWSGMYEPPTMERADRHADARAVRKWIGLPSAVRAEAFAHQTTHREVRFQVWRAAAPRGWLPVVGQWASRAEIAGLPMGNPQRRLLLFGAPK